MKTLQEIATSFVALALRYDWDKIKKLSEAEMQILFATVSAAGFKPDRIVYGKLVGHYHYNSQNESITNETETYPINDYCPYKVISQRGEDDYFATGWLNRAIHFVRARRGLDYKKRIKAFKYEIKRIIPLKPIRLTVEGDVLQEYPLSNNYFDYSQDNHKLNSRVGIHDSCNSWMDRKRATKAHDEIICRGCHLRVLFPKEIKTYNQLREYLIKFAQVPA